MFHCLRPAALLPWLIVATAAAADQHDGFELLFNGRDLDNWILTNTPAETWTIRDNMLVCSGKPYGEIRTREMYQNFIFEVEWRHLVPAGNAGIFLWADDLPARGVPFHRGIEVQVLEHAYGNARSHTTHGDIFPIHGARMTPDNGRGGSRAFPTEWRGKPSPEWNHYRITCADGAVTLEVNGAQVTSGRDCTPRKGYLCLESEGGIVHYRNMRIRKLPDTPIDDEHVAVSDRGYHSLYTGLSLSGWGKDGELPEGTRESDGWQVADWKLLHSGPATQLTSSELTAQTGFLLDVRRTADDAAVDVILNCGDRSITLVGIGTNDSTDSVERTPGQWNRIACDWAEGNVQLLINGQSVPAPNLPAPSPASMSLELRARGNAEFANIFARGPAP